MRSKQKQIKKLKKENSFLFIATGIMFLLFLAVVSTTFNLQSKVERQSVERPLEPLQEEQRPSVLQAGIADLSEEAILLKVPAVDREGKGVVTLLVVEAREGNGKTLVDIDSLLFFTDTQESIITAKKVSSDLTGLNLENYDLTYTLYAEADSIGGPSAGAALTIATIAALQDLELRENVMITGRIFSDGRIGGVSAISAKAEAVKNEGATIFLVPKGQGSETTFETERTCKMQGNNEVCTIEKIPIEKNVGEEIGIEVIEVSTIQEALEYFIA